MSDTVVPIRAGAALYRVFGLTLSTRFLFSNRLLPGSGSPDLAFDITHRAPFATSWDRATPVYTSSFRMQDGRSVAHLYQLQTCEVLRITDVADYYIHPDRITCHLPSAASQHLVEIHLLGAVLSLCLERKGLPALHASAVEVGGRAVGFLAANKGGKSALAATLMQAGFPLLADDVLAVEAGDGTFRARPAYPTMRLWPDEAAHFLGHDFSLEVVHPNTSKCRVPVGVDGFGAFCETPLPIACLYLPERRDAKAPMTNVDIIPVSPRDALVELVRASFVACMVDALKLQRTRMSLLARLVQEVPVRRVVYPSGFENVSAVRDAILRDVG